MTKASDNAFPSLLITEGTEPSAPAAGKQRLYIDSTSHKLMVTNSGGTESVIGPGGAAAIATDTIWDAKGDLVAATGADAASKLTVGANGTHLQADSTQATGLKYTGSVWTDYTPALTAVTTNPTLGSSTISGRWKALDDKTYIVRVKLVITTGGAWNAGSGEWKFSLPSITSAGTLPTIGSANVIDNGVGYFAGTCQVDSGNTVIWPVVIADDTGNRIMAHNKPVTWATGDNVLLTVIVEST